MKELTNSKRMVHRMLIGSLSLVELCERYEVPYTIPLFKERAFKRVDPRTFVVGAFGDGWSG